MIFSYYIVATKGEGVFALVGRLSRDRAIAGLHLRAREDFSPKITWRRKRSCGGADGEFFAGIVRQNVFLLVRRLLLGGCGLWGRLVSGCLFVTGGFLVRGGEGGGAPSSSVEKSTSKLNQSTLQVSGVPFRS